MTDSQRPSCPFADLRTAMPAATAQCPFHRHAAGPRKLTTPPPLAVQGGTHVVTPATVELGKDIGGVDALRVLCTRFYAHAFEDKTLAPFFFADDGAEAHGRRLADWICEKMGDGSPWTDSGRLGMRQPSHYRAWNSDKRDPSVRGRHFNLPECRTWMRLMFLSARECGLADHKPFFVWFQSFIGHFIRVYERTAPPFVTADALWSADADAVAAYQAAGCVMQDLGGDDLTDGEDE